MFNSQINLILVYLKIFKQLDNIKKFYNFKITSTSYNVNIIDLLTLLKIIKYQKILTVRLKKLEHYLRDYKVFNQNTVMFNELKKTITNDVGVITNLSYLENYIKCLINYSKFSKINYILEKSTSYIRFSVLNRDVLKLLRFVLDLKLTVLLNCFINAVKDCNFRKIKHSYLELQYVNYLKYFYLKKNIKNPNSFNNILTLNEQNNI